MDTTVRVRNPKRSKLDLAIGSSRFNWYDFYAGYSDEFVEDVLRKLQLPIGSVILDPWNGVGTTTEVAEHNGFVAIGFDINPVMVIVANARRIESGVAKSLEDLCPAILRMARRYTALISDVEPLTEWFEERTALHFRNLERAIQQILVGGREYCPLHVGQNVNLVSPQAAFFYLGLFRLVRSITQRFLASNPTWVKAAGPSERLS